MLRTRGLKAIAAMLALLMLGITSPGSATGVPAFDPCDEQTGATDANGQLVLPAPLDEPPTDADVTQNNGSVKTKYANQDTSNDLWYENTRCDWSIDNDGDPIPPTAKDADLDAQLSQYGITASEVREQLKALQKPILAHAQARQFPAELYPVDCERDDPAPTDTTYQPARDAAKEAAGRAIAETDGNVAPTWPVGAALANTDAAVGRAGNPVRPPSTPCYTPPAPRQIDDTKPFGGRDIIFVHGFRTDPLLEKILMKPGGPFTRWPSDKSAFFDSTGYWKQGANEYWKEHIEKNLKKGNGSTASNRHLVVAWPSNQWLVFGAHAALTQISKAMRNGQGVVNEADPSDTQDFCSNQCVIVTHSTGGLLMDVAMSIAAATKNDWLTRKIWGDISYISDQMKLQVALHDAFDGSHLATLGVGLAIAGVSFSGPMCNFVLNLLASIVGSPGTCGPLFAILESVLVDLTPVVSQVIWGPFIGTTPVPVVMTAGASPSADGLGKCCQLGSLIVHPGFDDGVLSANSQCANPNLVDSWPSGYVAQPTFLDGAINAGITASLFSTTHQIFTPVAFRVWDRGINTSRATYFYIDQSIDRILSWNANVRNMPYFVANTCTPFVSPTGMVQPVVKPRLTLLAGLTVDPWTGFPVLPAVVDPLNRYPNHYSFIVTTSDHFSGPLNKGVTASQCYEQTAAGSDSNLCHGDGTDNREEIRAITDSGIYNWVSSSMKDMVDETVLGKKVKFKFFGTKYEWWRWKRVYHRLRGWESKTETDYVYAYVLKP